MILPSSFEKLTLGAFALGFGIVATLGWFAPDLLFGSIGVRIDDAAGYAEIRAAYGGLFGASSLAFVAGIQRPELRVWSLRWGALVQMGFVFGRLVSLGLDGVPAWPAWVALSGELVGLFACVFCLQRRRGSVEI